MEVELNMERWKVRVTTATDLDMLMVSIARGDTERQIGVAILLDDYTPKKVEEILLDQIKRARQKAQDLNEKQEFVERVLKKEGIDI